MCTETKPTMIGGIQVQFPYKPYPSQLSMAHKIICGLKRSQNAILESPTGSGKTLALLCASLGWQKSEYEKLKCELKQEQEILNCINRRTSLVDEEFRSDGLQTSLVSLKKISFIDEDLEVDVVPMSPLKKQDSDDSDDASDFQQPKRFKTDSTNIMTGPPENLGTKDNSKSTINADSLLETSGHNDLQKPVVRKIPKIFYGTRTHKQVSQIIRELRKTVYKDTKMAILGSRDVACIHPVVSQEPNKTEACKNLLSAKTQEDGTCVYYRRAEMISTHKGLEAVGLSGAWDMEDLVAVGREFRACPYYATRELITGADIIFCPYNYLIDPLVRESLNLTLSGQIVILDEAHNIEDTARSAASCEVKETELYNVLTELERKVQECQDELIKSYEILAKMVSRLYKWLKVRSEKLSSQNNSSFDSSSIILSGTEMVAELSEMNMGPSDFEQLRGHYETVRSEANGVDDDSTPSGSALMFLSGFFIVLNFLYQNNLKYAEDYQIAILKSLSHEPHFKKNDVKSNWLTASKSYSREWVVSLNFWCLNPAIAFNAIKQDVRSIVLTSGTLSPMESFQSELGVPFANMLETEHVVKRDQIWVGTISEGPRKFSLNACYNNTERYEYQDEVGDAVLSICKIVPHGLLCFVPSYSLLNKLTSRWKVNGIWQQIHGTKQIIVEPRKKDDFHRAMMDFYRSVDESVAGNAAGSSGAIFLAVCRGKASEGLDFADNYARAVITIGIPFPNVMDLQLKLKRNYNDRYHRQRGMLPGNVWYEIQAYRALNQALGRCIRHKNDWGAIIMLDDRFSKSTRNTNGLSKWIRNALQHHRDFASAMLSLERFVKLQQANLGLTSVPMDCQEIPCTAAVNSPVMAASRVKSVITSAPKDMIFLDDF